jgi:hypothetical protein
MEKGIDVMRAEIIRTGGRLCAPAAATTPKSGGQLLLKGKPLLIETVPIDDRPALKRLTRDACTRQGAAPGGLAVQCRDRPAHRWRALHRPQGLVRALPTPEQVKRELSIMRHERSIGTDSMCQSRLNRAPATTFVITRCPSQSDPPGLSWARTRSVDGGGIGNQLASRPDHLALDPCTHRMASHGSSASLHRDRLPLRRPPADTIQNPGLPN